MSDNKWKETDVNGKHVSVAKIGKDDYAAEVSYKVYNNKGEHVASPVHVNLGNAKETKEFIIKKVNEDT